MRIVTLGRRHGAGRIALIGMLLFAVAFITTPAAAAIGCNTATARVAAACCPPNHTCSCPDSTPKHTHYECYVHAVPAVSAVLTLEPDRVQIQRHEQFARAFTMLSGPAIDVLLKTGTRRSSNAPPLPAGGGTSLAMLVTVVLIA